MYFQMLDDIVGEFQLNVGRFGSMLGFLMPYLLIKKPSLSISRRSIIPIILLSLITFACNIFIYASTVYIPVGTANTVINVSFLSIILIMHLVNIFCGGTLWNMRSLVADVLAVMFTCFGVVFVIQPELLFSKVQYFRPQTENYTSFCNPHRFDNELNLNATSVTTETVVEIYKQESWKGYVHAVLAGLFNALRVMFNKSVLRHEDIYPVMFWTALLATVISVIVTVIFEKFLFPPSVICTLIVFGHASATGLQTVLLVAGMKYVPSTDVTLIYSFSVALLFLFQFTFLKNASPAPNNSVAVMAAILVSCISIGKPLLEVYLLRKNKKKSDR